MIVFLASHVILSGAALALTAAICFGILLAKSAVNPRP